MPKKSASTVIEDELKEGNPTPEVEQGGETVEELQAAIAELNKKLQEAEVEEDEEEEMVELPVANIMLKIERGMVVPKMNVTPPEVFVLTAMHHPGAGGNPIENITLLADESVDEAGQKVTKKRTVRVSPSAFRRFLVGKYGNKRVDALFPDLQPKLMVTFRKALSLGIQAKIPTTNLFDYKVEPLTSGGE